MLTLQHIDVRFDETHHVLKNISCEIRAGDFIVIVGANGSGKSTLFDTIAGRIKPSHGSIILDSVDITALDEQQRAGMITRIFQNTHLNTAGALTVAQNFALAQYSRRTARLVDSMHAMPRTKIAQLLEEIGMSSSLLDKQMNHLSGGQRQLIAFSMATQLIPRILLLDEPTAALDPQAATRLLSHATRFIKEHAVTTLLITHDPQIALSIGNQVWVLEEGRMLRRFGPEEKKSLTPEQLSGQIDYAQLATLWKLADS